MVGSKKLLTAIKKRQSFLKRRGVLTATTEELLDIRRQALANLCRQERIKMARLNMINREIRKREAKYPNVRRGSELPAELLSDRDYHERIGAVHALTGRLSEIQGEKKEVLLAIGQLLKTKQAKLAIYRGKKPKNDIAEWIFREAGKAIK